MEIIKPLLAAGLLIVILRTMGLMNSASYYTQAALVEAGFRDAGDSRLNEEEAFDYNFTVRDQSGARIPFEKFKGKVIFLNLWATWCGPCRAEMPTIQSLYTQSNKDSVVFVILSLDEAGDEARIASYIKHGKFTFPVFRPSGYLTEQLNVPGIPTTFIVSKSGKIVGKEVGATNFDTPRFRKFLERLTME